MHALLALVVGTAAIGMDVGWQPIEGGGLEYIIQVEPDLLSRLKPGDEITGGVRPSLRDVRRYRIVVGTGLLPHNARLEQSILVPPRGGAGSLVQQPGPQQGPQKSTWVTSAPIKGATGGPHDAASKPPAADPLNQVATLPDNARPIGPSLGTVSVGTASPGTALHGTASQGAPPLGTVPLGTAPLSTTPRGAKSLATASPGGDSHDTYSPGSHLSGTWSAGSSSPGTSPAGTSTTHWPRLDPTPPPAIAEGTSSPWTAPESPAAPDHTRYRAKNATAAADGPRFAQPSDSSVGHAFDDSLPHHETLAGPPTDTAWGGNDNRQPPPTTPSKSTTAQRSTGSTQVAAAAVPSESYLAAKPGPLPLDPAVRPVSSEMPIAGNSSSESAPRHQPAAGSDAPAVPPRPWLVLTLVLFALFASLGANVFLGWIAHDSRSRYRRHVDQNRLGATA